MVTYTTLRDLTRGLASLIEAVAGVEVVVASAAQASSLAAAADLAVLYAGPMSDHSELISQISQEAPLTVVAAEPSPDAVGAFINAGASNVVSENAAPRALGMILTQSDDDVCVVPRRAVRVMAAAAERRTGLPPPLTEQQIHWMRQLANGATVAQLSKRSGYSERMMFRHLDTVYRLLGAESRTEALLRLDRLNLLGDSRTDQLAAEV